jgi:hypothetical protein
MTVPPSDDRFPSDPPKDAIITTVEDPRAEIPRRLHGGMPPPLPLPPLPPPQSVPNEQITYVEEDYPEDQERSHLLWGVLGFLCGFLCAGTMVYLVLR